MIEFTYKHCFDGKQEICSVRVPMLHYSGDYLLFAVQLTEPFWINICKSFAGFYLCLVNCETSVYVSSLFDSFEIADGLMPFLGEKDAVSVAFAIKHIAGILSYPRSKRRAVSLPTEDLPF